MGKRAYCKLQSSNNDKINKQVRVILGMELDDQAER
jgi:hypothetical protein